MLADLAQQVARDGEGARKLVEIIVDGATTKASARKIAMSVANSPLVKTAIAGEDANWGRVVMAVGKAGEPANRDKLSISFNGIRVAKSGARVSTMAKFRRLPPPTSLARPSSAASTAPFEVCASPLKHKVKRRKHRFEVRAIDRAGNVDATPAIAKWKVKRRK